MSNEIAKFDITDHIRNRVREVIVSSVPDEEMDRMVRAEFDRFFVGRKEYNREIPSAFSGMVFEMLKELLGKRVEAWIARETERVFDEDGTERLVGEAVAKIAPRVQEAFMADITARAIAALKYAMTQ